MDDRKKDTENVNEFRCKLRQLKAATLKTIAESGKPDAEEALRLLADMRTMLPDHVERARQSEEIRTRTDTMPVETEEDFELAAVIDGIESLASDISNMVAQKKDALLEKVLRGYYEMEEASHDPANAHLLEPVEAMRAAYERAYGWPIPPKKKK